MALSRTTAARLGASLDGLVDAVVGLVSGLKIERNNREAGSFVFLGIPDHSFGSVSPDVRAQQVSIKRRYDQFAEVVRVLLGRAPEDLLERWKAADDGFRRWIELQPEWSLKPTQAANEETIREGGRAVGEVLAVLDAIGDRGVLVVPDTNSLIDEPNPGAYRSVAGEAEFTLVLLPTVLGELDDLKVAHKNPEVRERAKKVISRVKGWRKQAQTRGGSLIDGTTVDGSITVRAQHVEPNMEASLSWLDDAIQDDRIVAAVLAVQAEHPAARVVLVTGDINLQNKADAALIESAEIPTGA